MLDLNLILRLVLLGIGLYLIDFIPMDATIKRIIKIVVIIVIVLWLIQTFNLLGPLPQYRLGRS